MEHLTQTRPYPATPGRIDPNRPHQTSLAGASPSPSLSSSSSVTKHSVHTLVFRSLKRCHDLFISDQNELPPYDENLMEKVMRVKARDQYGPIMHLLQDVDIKEANKPKRLSKSHSADETEDANSDNGTLVSMPPPKQPNQSSSAVVLSSGTSIIPRKAPFMPKPDWHPPWKLMRVVSGHIGWVRCLSVEPGNEWFASGSNDRIIKIWDLAKGTLKLSLTGHISAVRGLAVSARQPYLFSCGEDKTVKCWDLEYNKVIRHYHGHLSGVYCIALHPTIDVLVTGGRDSTGRVWDMRTKAQIHALAGHTNTIASVICQSTEPQVVTGSHDTTVRLWDLVAGKTRAVLTHHKKSIRSLVFHPKYNMFASGAPENIKQWRCPDGKFVQNLSGHNSIVNCLAINQDNVLVSGGDNGTLFYWDWKTGYNFQRGQSSAQSGSIDSEAGIFEMAFDQSGCRLITAEADKTIKIYKEDEEATPETHPVNWKPDIIKRRRY